MTFIFRAFSLLLLVTTIATPVQAATDVFTEDFTNSSASWANFDSSGQLAHTLSGGPDGGAFASGPRSFFGLPNGPTDVTVILRARPGGIWNSSGNAFVRDWSVEGISEVSAYVRHDAPTSLTYFLRVAINNGSPGHVYTSGISVPGGDQWTQIKFDVTPESTQLASPENGTWTQVFSGNPPRHVQFGVFVPTGFSADSTAYTFGIDKVTISTPEPASLVLTTAGLLGTACFVGRRSRGIRS